MFLPANPVGMSNLNCKNSMLGLGPLAHGSSSPAQEMYGYAHLSLLACDGRGLVIS
jgi:hypothetical protein